MAASTFAPSHRWYLIFGSGMAIGILGGLIGLGGAEFRLPLLISLFGFAALPAVILNKATSLVVVASALVFRAAVVPLPELLEHWDAIANLAAGSVLGAWGGASLATKLRREHLHQIIAALLILIAVVLVSTHGLGMHSGMQPGLPRLLIGLSAGLGIGVVASLLGVAGGELLIPTLILLFGVSIKLAGSLSLVISLPTMIAGFLRYSRDASFAVVAANRRFIAIMALGSIMGTLIGSRLLVIAPSAILLPVLSAVLVISAIKLWRAH